jgi:peptide/nickel transport system substrate-binding protein
VTDGGHATRHGKRRPLTRTLAAIGVVAMITTALVGVGVGTAGAGTAAKGPKQGGELRFGLEAETTGGYCLNQAQLAISGIQVAAAIYDTLTVPNAKGQYVPYLAKSVTPNADFTQWTIGLRDGVKFHDGETLDANAVKLNLDSYRGTNPNLPARLFTFVFTNIADVAVVDPLTVRVTMKKPWPAFPGYLYSTGRLGMMAPAQMNDPATCATNMIGTGPFKLVDWKQNESLVVDRNPNYWQKDAKGNQLPYLNRITFVPIVDASARDNQLEGGQLDVEHTSTALSIDKLQQLGSSQVTILRDKSGTRDERYYMLNVAKAPFNDITARQAVAYAINRQEMNQIRNKDMFQLASGIYDKGATGYVKNSGFPQFNLKKATQLATQYKAAHGGQFNVTLLTTPDPDNSAEAQLLQQQLSKAGITANISQLEQSAEINDALSGNFNLLLWRNIHSDPQFTDSASYVWFYTGSPVNFGKFNDPQFQGLLDQGRAAATPEAQVAAYTQLNKLMSQQLYDLPMWFVDWVIASKPNVKGLLGPPLPDNGGKARYYYGRIPVLGLYKS